MDANPDFVEGQALDLAHGLPFYPSAQILKDGIASLKQVETA
jgi:hypothetical protein